MSLLFNLKVVHVHISLSFTFYICILDGYYKLMNECLFVVCMCICMSLLNDREKL